MSIVRLSKQAEHDLDQIADWIAEHNPQAAVHVLNSLEETFRILAANPGIGRRREDLRPNLRVFPGKSPANNYVICYFPFDMGIQIATVIHARRDWIGMFERDER